MITPTVWKVVGYGDKYLIEGTNRHGITDEYGIPTEFDTLDDALLFLELMEVQS